MHMARSDNGIGESDSNGSKEKQKNIWIYFQGRTNEISLWTECDMKIKRGVKNDSKISGRMAQWSHHQLRRGRLGKTVWRGRQTSVGQF